jgi:hypothetical protein
MLTSICLLFDFGPYTLRIPTVVFLMTVTCKCFAILCVGESVYCFTPEYRDEVCQPYKQYMCGQFNF